MYLYQASRTNPLLNMSHDEGVLPWTGRGTAAEEVCRLAVAITLRERGVTGV